MISLIKISFKLNEMKKILTRSGSFKVLGRWGNVDEPAALRSFLEAEVGKAVDNPAYQPWKPNCQLTPTTEDIVGGRSVGAMVVVGTYQCTKITTSF